MHLATLPGQAGRETSRRQTKGRACKVDSDSSPPPSSAPMDTNLLSNIQKLFSERIDVFSPVEFNKVRSTFSFISQGKVASHTNPGSPRTPSEIN